MNLLAPLLVVISFVPGATTLLLFLIFAATWSPPLSGDDALGYIAIWLTLRMTIGLWAHSFQERSNRV